MQQQQHQQQIAYSFDQHDLQEQLSPHHSLPVPNSKLHAHAYRGMTGDTNNIGASFAPSSSSRTSPFPIAPAATSNAMAASVFPAQSQTLRLPVTSQSNYSGLSSTIAPHSIRPFDREITTMPVGTPFASSVLPASSSALIRRLPRDTSEDTLKVMMTFSKDLSAIDLQPPDQDDRGFRSAILSFSTQAGAHEVKSMLDGKNTGGASLVVEVLEGNSPTGAAARRYAGDLPVSAAPSTSASSTASSHSNSGRHASRFNGLFMPVDNLSAPINGYFENPPSSAVENGHYPSMYNAQSPIGNHRRPNGIDSGKALIKNETAEDDETSQLLSDLHPSKEPNPVGYGEPSLGTQRRSTAPHIPVERFSNLTLTTSMDMGPSSLPPYTSGGNAHFGHTAMSPTAMTAGPQPQPFSQNFRNHPQFPPVNPADQNPPCNTLYVGNLPANTSEEELKAVFSKQRGYKRLCFRTKQNGPMCFVEFEDVSFATKALNELYGHPLHNSVKGGIRLSFSKNPLGVRSGQNPNQAVAGGLSGHIAGGVLNGHGTNGYAAATGPPPGITGPPGFGNHRGGFSSIAAAASSSVASNPYMSTQFGASSNVWNEPSAMAAGGPSRGLSSYNPQMYGA